MKLTVDDGEIRVERPSEQQQHRALHGLTRSLVANMVEGVTNGFSQHAGDRRAWAIAPR